MGQISKIIDESDLAIMLEGVSDAVAAFTPKGHLIYSNTCFENLPKQLNLALSDYLHSAPNNLPPLFDLLGYKIKTLKHKQNTFVFIDRLLSVDSLTVLTLKHLNKLLDDSDNIYQAAAKAIQESLGWRWVAISRFKHNNRLELLSYRENHSRLEGFEYEIGGTPCQTVIDTNQFTFFEDVCGQFPNYQALHELGAVNYAGLVFKGGDGKAIGHIMVMHDNQDVNFAYAQQIIDLASTALYSHFKLHNAKSQLEQIIMQANIDSLTKIGNRSAYESALKDIDTDFKKRQNDDWTIAMIDLDQLKPLNDSLGHKAGDRFIQLMAQEIAQLGRKTDLSFRIGGDEFAIIFAQDTLPIIHSILARFNQAVMRISQKLDFPIDASIGFASLNEVDGSIAAWTALADQRMYYDKQSKKAKVAGITQ